MNSPLSLLDAHPRLPVELHRGCRPGELHLLALAVPLTADDCMDVGEWLKKHAEGAARAER